MNLLELREKIDDLVGQVVEVEGYFVLVVGQEGYLASSFDEPDQKNGWLKVDVPNLKARVMAKVPPRGGSK